MNSDQDRFDYEVTRQQQELDDREIRTSFVYPPIPVRDQDWQAIRVDDEDDSLVGWGATEQEAIQDLIEQEQCK